MGCSAGKPRLDIAMVAAPMQTSNSIRPTVRRFDVRWIGGSVLVAIVASLPFWPFANSYFVAVGVRALIFVALGQAWNVIAGIGGQLSLGHGVFFGIGAYATAMLFNDVGLSPWIGCWAGAAAAMAVALVIALTTFHLRGIYFALGTVVISLGFEKLARYYVEFTGGDTGLAVVFKGNSPLDMQWRAPTIPFWISLALVVAYYLLTRWILRSRFGLELQAIRDDEAAAAAAGVHVYRTKLLGLLLSAGMTALAGTLYVQFYLAIDPGTAFGLFQAIQIQLPSLIGGLGTAAGPVAGGILMVLAGEATNVAAAGLALPSVDVLVYGFLLLVVILRAPEGLVRHFSLRSARGPGSKP
jgi:branched-chain amino acid transport system permease protein